MASPLRHSSAPHHVSLSNHDKQQLVDFVARHCSVPSELTDLQVLALVQRHPVALPSIQASLDALIRNEISLAVVENLPKDNELPPPPINGVRPATKGWRSEVSMLTLLSACGLKAFSFCEERKGQLIQQVAPASMRSGEVSSLGSVELGFHTDKGFLPSGFRPEYLCLHGLVNEDSIPTMLADLGQALEILREKNPSTERVLRQPRFRLALPACLRSGHPQDIYSQPRPLISESLGIPMFAGNLGTLRATDDVAGEAVAALQASIAAVAVPILLKQGLACVFSNHHVLHGRGALSQSRRWLQRVYGRRCLQDLREASARRDGVSFPLEALVV